MSIKNSELERRNTDSVILNPVTKSPSSWKKRFRKDKKNNGNVFGKGSLPEEVSNLGIPLGEEEFSLGSRTSCRRKSAVHDISTSQSSRLKRNRSIDYMKGRTKNDKVEKERITRRYSTPIQFVPVEGISFPCRKTVNKVPASEVEELNRPLPTCNIYADDNEEDMGSNVNFSSVSHLGDSLDLSNLTCSSQSLFCSDKYDDVYMRLHENDTDRSDDVLPHKDRSTRRAGHQEKFEDASSNTLPQRRKQGTSSHPVIRGRSVTSSTVNAKSDERKLSLDSSLNLLNIPIENKRNRSPSPSRFGKRLARKFVASSESMLQYAVTNQDYDMLEKMLTGNETEYDINFLYPPGVSILHQACVLGDFSIVKLLVQKGADVKIKTWRNLTPTKLAVTYGHFDVAQLLLLTGADVEDIKNGF